MGAERFANGRGSLAHLWARLLSLSWTVSSRISTVPTKETSVILAARVPREEKMMIEQFGDEYREYMGKTGRFLPK